MLFLLLLIPLVILFYWLAVRSRKSYRCPECGETVRVEHMDASRCGMCGALLKDQDSHHV